MDGGMEWIAHYGYGAIFGLLMLGIVGLPVPDETLLLFAGYASFKGDLRLEATFAAALLGSCAGISLSYALGRIFGPQAVKKLSALMHIHPEQAATTSHRIAQWGKYALIAAYFLPGIRHLAALVMGASSLPASTFARFAYTGAALWCGTFIGIGYVAGERWQALSSQLHRLLPAGAALVLVAVGITIWLRQRRSTA